MKISPARKWNFFFLNKFLNGNKFKFPSEAFMKPTSQLSSIACRINYQTDTGRESCNDNGIALGFCFLWK